MTPNLDKDQLGVRCLSEEEKELARAAIDEARRAQAEMLKERGGEPFPSSWHSINDERSDRARRLAGGSQE
jgi:hypothetical protein